MLVEGYSGRARTKAAAAASSFSLQVKSLFKLYCVCYKFTAIDKTFNKFKLHSSSFFLFFCAALRFSRCTFFCFFFFLFGGF